MLFERPGAGEKAILVHQSERPHEQDLDELHELAKSAGVSPLARITASRNKPNPKYFVGKGKIQEIQELIRLYPIDLVLVNQCLSPAQERNLERAFGVRVVDRTGLILDIFAQRAQSFEGKLQVELAQLEHLSTRLIRGWSHLERQKGGIGLRGPGETQLETDRRLIGIRIRQIKRRLDKVDRQRRQSRIARKKAEVPTVGLVGYTNAGKSTLFNALSGSEVYAADQLFATLDPTLRKISLADGVSAILADTVGFIRQLPHELVAAFRSTLQEVEKAHLLLHVIDATSEHKQEMIDEVNRVLAELGGEHIPQILVLNKIDLLDYPCPSVERNESGVPTKVWVSAQDHRGFEQLKSAIVDSLQADRVRRHICLLPQQGAIRSNLFSYAKVLSEQVTETGGWEMEIEIQRKNLGIIKDLRVEPIS